MGWLEWLPASLVAGVYSLVIWLCRQRIGAYLTREVQHKFDVRLAAIQSEFREKEARLQADWRVQEKQIDSLQSGALSALSMRQNAVDKRRLEAVDQLWEAVDTLAPIRVTASWMEYFGTDEMLKIVEGDEKLSEMISAADGAIEALKMSGEAARKARPFVTPMAWAYFSVYRSVLSYAVVQAKLIGSGLKYKILKPDSIISLVKQSLPEFAERLDNFGITVAYGQIEELESRVLSELQLMISDSAQDDENVERAAKILKAVRRVDADINKPSL